MTTDVNVAEVERWASALGGAALAVVGMRQRSLAGAMLAASGGALIVRGATGHCPVYSAAGVATNEAADDTRARLSGSRGILVDQTLAIRRGPDDLYRFWRHLENLPRFMSHVVSVRQLDDRRSHWVVRAPGRRTVSWDAEVINDIPHELIAWRTVHGADVVSAGSVRFRFLDAERGTEVHVRMQYDPPGGHVGAAIIWLLGHDPAATILEDLRRLKRILETGEMPTIKGQTHGKRRLR